MKKVNVANANIINFFDGEFVFSDKLIEWNSSIDSEYLWGLGERNT